MENENIITGTLIQEYFKCKRQASLHINNIGFYSENMNIQLGKIIESCVYERRSNKNKEYRIGNVVVDYIDFKNKILHETKKSSKGIEFFKYQLIYYLYLVGNDYSGIIEIPKERKKIQIVMTEEYKRDIENAISDINEMIKTKNIIPFIKKPICKGCSLQTYCFL